MCAKIFFFAVSLEPFVEAKPSVVGFRIKPTKIFLLSKQELQETEGEDDATSTLVMSIKDIKGTGSRTYHKLLCHLYTQTENNVKKK